MNDETRLKKVASELISTPTLFPEKKHATLSSLLYPKYLTTSEVIKLVERAHTPKRYSGDGFSYAISRFLRSCPVNEIENLLTGISELALRKPYDQDYQPISKQYGYLARQFVNLAHIALDRIPPSETSNGLSDVLVAMERSDGSSTIKKHPISISDRLSSRPNQKAHFFLVDIEYARKTEKKRDLDKRPWCRIPHHWMWKIQIEDFQWIKNIISDNSRSTYEQDTAYFFWLDQVQRQDCLNEKVEELKSLATTRLRKKWLQNALQPKKKQDWEKRQEASRKKRQERQKVRRAKNGASVSYTHLTLPTKA